ncbi:MAG: App1 family protein, partial [Phycisphaeraceae bacterium]|nr:App1 family protein [Phycisphaeraceae bacterium]
DKENENGSVKKPGSSIRSDEQVVFFTTVGRLNKAGTAWVIPIHGWIYEPEKDNVLQQKALSVLAETLGVEPGTEEAEHFTERAGLFVADNEWLKKISVRIGDRYHTLSRSGRNGHFRGAVELDPAEAEHLAPSGVLPFTAVTDEKDPRLFTGRALLVEPEGLSVISDIDDTIKDSHVTNKKRLLRKTFLEEFETIDGMAEVYRRWVRRDGAQIHFVSSSPWQLYPPLRTMTRSAGFPTASWNLKDFRLKDASLLNLFADPLETKPAVIEPLLSIFPKRKFVLVGDSGEKDPEIYGRLARVYGDQILAVYIRDVTASGKKRYEEAFAGVPEDKWMVFHIAEQLPQSLRELLP